jgi:hypothetical protein
MTYPPGPPGPPNGPYGQDPYGTNPYGQDPYWGGQQPQGGQYQYPQGGQQPYPQGGQYPQGDPYAGGGYPPQPPQQFLPPGQQPGPGWQGGPYPPGPPPGGRNSRTPWLIVGGIAVVGVIALVVILVFTLGGNDKKSPHAAPSSTPETTNSSTPAGGTDQNATNCTPNVSAGEKPTGSTVSAGKLSFPISATPGWPAFSDDQSPNLIGAVGVGQEVPGASNWMMQAEVAMTNFVPSMDVSAQASKLMQCVASGPGYMQSSPTLGPTKTSSITVDGVKAARIDADITIGDTSRNVKGDSVVIVAVDTKPVTIFMGATPIGDAANAAIINKVIAALKVSKS